MDPTLSELRQRADKLKPKVSYEDLNLALGTIKQSIYQAIDEAGVPYRGLFDMNASYRRSDIVNYRNGLWICLGTSQGQAPEFSDSWQLMLEAGGGAGRVLGAAFTRDDLVQLDLSVNSTHTFNVNETAVPLVGTVADQKNVSIIDTAWGSATGVHLPRGAVSLTAAVFCYMVEAGATTRCIVRFKVSTLADAGDKANFQDGDFYIFQTADSNEGSVSFTPGATDLPADSVLVFTTQQESSAPTITFEAANVMGTSVPAVNIELNAFRGPV